MSDSDGRDVPRVTECTTPASVRAAATLFVKYRAHYGEPDAEEEPAHEWLAGMVRDGKFRVFVASVDDVPIGLATVHEVPASLRMQTFWLLRDLYVVPEGRGQGAGRALVRTVKAKAESAGAIRLSLVTEADNSVALALYESLGFTLVEGLTSLSLELSEPAADASP